MFKKVLIGAAALATIGGVAFADFVPTQSGVGNFHTLFVTGPAFVQGPLTVGGAIFSMTGCSATTPVGGPTFGTYTSGTNGTCTVVVTMNGIQGMTAVTGWSCMAQDTTTPADAQKQTATTTTTATIAGTTASGDVVRFRCDPY